jgi:putative flippase GtrA
MNNTIDKLLAYKTQNLFVQLFRYFFVGAFAFVVDFGLLYLLTSYAGCYYLVSATISFVAGLLVNYLISVKWVFQVDKAHNPWLDFLMFAFIGIIGLLLNACIIFIFTEIAGLYYLLSKIISTIIVFLWNFLGRRYVLVNLVHHVG